MKTITPATASTIRRKAAQDRDDIRTECAGSHCLRVVARPARRGEDLIAAGLLMLAGHDTGGGVRLCQPAFDLELPLTVVTNAYAATDERRAIKVNRRS